MRSCARVHGCGRTTTVLTVGHHRGFTFPMLLLRLASLRLAADAVPVFSQQSPPPQTRDNAGSHSGKCHATNCHAEHSCNAGCQRMACPAALQWLACRQVASAARTRAGSGWQQRHTYHAVATHALVPQCARAAVCTSIASAAGTRSQAIIAHAAPAAWQKT
jgi:hypothetical protein